jgi:hypothetical protein
MMMKRLLFWALIFLMMGMTACTGGGSETAVAQTNPTPEITDAESCPVTQPQSPQFVPPAPYPEIDPSGGFWYGTAKLWTDLQPDGLWYGLPKSNAGYSNKLALWREGYSQTEEPQPEITLSAHQLAGEATVKPFVHGTNAYHPDYGQFMMTGIELPALGCWEITAEYRDASLSFVVWVAP